MPPVTPTAEFVRSILAFVRAGGFPAVAAEAAGIGRELFAEWLRQGQAASDPEARAFAQAVRQAAAVARLTAEIAVYNKRPLDWLKCGPGREAPGWTNPVRAPAAEQPTAGLDPVALGAVLLDALADEPAARAKLAAALARFDPSPPDGTEPAASPQQIVS